MSTQPKQPSTLQKLSKLLNVSETELLIAIRQMGLEPSAAELSWKDAIANHLNRTKPQALNGHKPTQTSTPETPESFSIEDSEEFVEWDEVEAELGDTALALVEELGLNQDAISKSDLAALRELVLSNPIHQNLAEHIGAVGSVQEGLTSEHIRTQYETGTAIGEAGNTALMIGMLQSQLNGLEQAYNLQTAINSDFQKILNSQLEKLGKMNEEKPNETVETLGKQATTHQQNSKKTATVRNSKLDVMAIKNSLKK